MSKRFFSISLIVPLLILGVWVISQKNQLSEDYGAPPYVGDEMTMEQDIGKLRDLSKWVREGPLRVGLQAGHWKNYELPDELRRLREMGGGTNSGSVAEWEVNLKIAEETKKILEEEEGIAVDILPATIPPGYYADAVVAIHADGSTDLSKSGFKVASPRRDMSGKAGELVKLIEEIYQRETGLEIDPNITRNMTGYYAFSWRRFEHSTHPMATAVILETGFLTNPQEAKMLISDPELPANAIAQAIMIFLRGEVKF